MVVMMGVFGFGGLAALLLMPARLVPHVLLSVTVIHEVRLPVRVALLHPGMLTYMSRVGVSRLAERSPRTGLTVLRPGCTITASSSGGLMMVSAVAPVTVRTMIRVRGPAAEPR